MSKNNKNPNLESNFNSDKQEKDNINFQNNSTKGKVNSKQFFWPIFVLVITPILLGVLVFGLFQNGFFGGRRIDIINDFQDTFSAVDTFALEEFETCDEVVFEFQNAIERMKTKRRFLELPIEPGPIFPLENNQEFDSNLGNSNPAPNEFRTTDFSGTNNQVQGVDEGDFIKTNGQEIFQYQNGIIQVFRSSNDGIIQTIGQIKLPIFENDNNYPYNPEVPISDRQTAFPEFGFYNQDSTKLHLYEDKLAIIQQVGFGVSGTRVLIYNISADSLEKLKNQEDYKPLETIMVDGNLLDTRLINGDLYLVNNFFLDFSDFDQDSQGFPKLNSSTDISTLLPKFKIGEQETKLVTECKGLKYPSPLNEIYNAVVNIGIDLDDLGSQIGGEVILGNSQNIYVSQENLYLSQANYNLDELKTIQEKSNSDTSNFTRESTTIFKFKLNEAKINYYGQGSIPGVLNDQFSMDEFENNLRLVSTQFNLQERKTSNNLFVLNSDLEIQGRVENLAKGERIFSSRFIGEKAFMVTFRQVDPLFTFDLSDPRNPKQVGELKIPGFSDYLHPLKDNLLLGVGRQANQESGQTEGLKLSLFDVTDLGNPKEVEAVEIGINPTQSEVSNDHKALLWDSRNNLLILPVELYIPSELEKDPNFQFGQFDFQGSYIYKLTSDNKLELETRITHIPEKEVKQEENDNEEVKIFDENGQVIGIQERSSDPLEETLRDNFADQSYFIKRQLYINNFLYTISGKKIQANNLLNFEKISEAGFDDQL